MKPYLGFPTAAADGQTHTLFDRALVYYISTRQMYFVAHFFLSLFPSLSLFFLPLKGFLIFDNSEFITEETHFQVAAQCTQQSASFKPGLSNKMLI